MIPPHTLNEFVSRSERERRQFLADLAESNGNNYLVATKYGTTPLQIRLMREHFNELYLWCENHKLRFIPGGKLDRRVALVASRAYRELASEIVEEVREKVCLERKVDSDLLTVALVTPVVSVDSGEL